MHQNRMDHTYDPRAVAPSFSGVHYNRMMNMCSGQLGDPPPCAIPSSISFTTFSMYSRSLLPYGEVENLAKSLSVKDARMSEEILGHHPDLLQLVVLYLSDS